jgi:L-seryl-tRNA(Ser) seleniumtransferase
VGTTNRTKLVDYEKAVDDKTRLILRVHPSNYRIVGFTAMPSVSELAALAHQHGLLLYEDLGSGALIDLANIGMTEPVVRDSIAACVDVVTFSGDKLLGGPQAGIIAGKAEFIDRLRKNPLYRALRVNKTVYAALEATLESYRRGSERSEIPVIRMLSMTGEEIGKRAVGLVEQFAAERSKDAGLVAEVIDGRSAVGGGAAPDLQPETKLIALCHLTVSASALEQLLRRSDPPIISRIVDDRVVLDLRTVTDSEEEELLNALCRI